MINKVHDLENAKRDIMTKMQKNNIDIYDDGKKIERLEKIFFGSLFDKSFIDEMPLYLTNKKIFSFLKICLNI